MGLIKKVWNKLGEIYDEDQQIDYNDEDFYSGESHNQHERNYYQYDSRWANPTYGVYIGGPLKIDNDSTYIHIDCYEAGLPMSANRYMTVYVPSKKDGLRALSAYWSGGVLYAQLSDGTICEWNDPNNGMIR